MHAVLPHTALQSVVSSSGLARYYPGLMYGEKPSFREECILPPLTPLPRAANIRSVHTDASTQSQFKGGWDSVPCLAIHRTGGTTVSGCILMDLLHLPSYPPSHKCGFANHTSPRPSTILSVFTEYSGCSLFLRSYHGGLLIHDGPGAFILRAPIPEIKPE